MKFPLHQIINALEERAERGGDNELLSAIRQADGSILIHIPKTVVSRTAHSKTFNNTDAELLAQMGVSLA